MNLAIQSYKSFNPVAVLAALFLHLLIIALYFLPASPTVISHQAIQVSFVAPSTKAQNKNIEEVVKDDKALTKIEKTKETQVSSRETSGVVHQDATALNSAETEAVFDAAYLNNPVPSYPIIAKKRGIQGKVLLEVAVSEKGEALNVKIYQSSGSKILDESALKTVKNWRFVAAKKSGKEVASTVLVPIEFKIV